MKRFTAVVIPIILGVTPLAARAVENGNAFVLASATTQTPPKIDGTLNDPAWKNASHAQLQWDFTFRRPAEQSTDTYLLVDSRYLYVAFVAKQREQIVATQHTNDQPLPADDVVRVYVWPAGDTGNEYGFVANPAGTRYEFSSENTAFSPVWDAVATTSANGYIVTERIPLNVMRGDGRKVWRVQFDRRIRSSNQVTEWAHADAQGGTDSSLYAGYLNGMDVAARAARTKPRLAVYGLGEYGTPSAAGSTSRMGADLSVPLTQTSSFVATFHPDYSNVELDQQSISPTVFPRRFSEVRPFFTQGANFFNFFNCNDCLNYPLLYTPAIPTPRDGFAVEGKQGAFTFGAFDASGAQRNDAAQSLYWRTADRRIEAVYQRVAVDMPGVHDVASYYQLVAGNSHNFNAYATLGGEQGSLVTDGAEGRYHEYGINFYTPKSGLFAALHDVGSQYAPLDAFNQINDVKGPSIYAYREFDFGPHAPVQNVTVSQDFARYRDSDGELNDAYNYSNLSLNTRTQWTLGLSTGQNYLRFNGQPGGFANQNGISLFYGQNTSTPKGISYYVGRYGEGFLRSTDMQAALRLTRLATLSLEAYQTNDALDSGGSLVQWLERVSLGYQIGPGQSIAAGWRRIIGTAPTFFDSPEYTNATNLSFAYYRRMKSAELYFAFGNPNQLNTQHTVILKLIRYVGADKGT